LITVAAPTVLVIGAGPAGLAAALSLRARGVAVTLLEAEEQGRVRPGSRALFVHRDSLRLLEAASPGLGTAIAGYGLVWRVRRTLYRGRQLFERTYPEPLLGRMPAFTSLRQVDTERFLLQACTAAEVQIVWGSRVESVSASSEGVTVRAADGSRWSAAYVIGADGARSTARRATGIAVSGPPADAFHVVIDVEADEGSPLLRERTFHYRHPGLGGRNVLLVPFTGGFQVDVQCRPDDSPADWGSEEGARRWLRLVVDDSDAGPIRWASTYRFLRVVADQFTDVHRRVLLIGEAAHLFPPFGARGMNSGFADAAVAASAVAEAFRAGTERERAALIGRFAEVRHGAALRNAAATERVLAHLMPGPGGRIRQAAAAVLNPVLPACGRWMESAPYGAAAGPADPSGMTRGRY
jgi:3-(3-hydroxy-phenyl)propionate hydroxylase